MKILEMKKNNQNENLSIWASDKMEGPEERITELKDRKIEISQLNNREKTD